MTTKLIERSSSPAIIITAAITGIVSVSFMSDLSLLSTDQRIGYKHNICYTSKSLAMVSLSLGVFVVVVSPLEVVVSVVSLLLGVFVVVVLLLEVLVLVVLRVLV